MAKPQKKDGAHPRHILIEETIGWMEHDALRQFHEGQQITNPADIRALIERGAKFLELK